MYMPAHFDESRPDEVVRLLKDYPLGALVITGPDGLDANHLPFEYEPESGRMGCLRAHIARANPLWQQASDGDQVLVIFQGSQGYLSPNWYPSKHETHRQVPTWNYQVVHVHGELLFHDDERYVRGVVARLTREHEQRTGEPRPWRMTDSDADYIDGMLKAIVGIEIRISRIVAKSKLSQNKELRDRRGAVDALQNHNEQLAKAMRDTFPSDD
ncbi:MAG: FMN-binding negative transcriptional regulator [Quisquiliibacterium sp.]